MQGSDHTTPADDVRLAQAGDRAAFGRVMDAFLPMTYRISVRWLGSVDEARDACQDAWLRVWERFESFDSDRPFAAWLTTVVTRICMDRIRRRQRAPWRWPGHDRTADPNPASPEPSPEEVATWGDLGAIVLRLLNRLPPTQRIVFALRDLEDLDVASVAQVTGLSTASVKTNLSYARRAIRQILNDDYRLKDITL